nr:discoidin domain-containing protein [Porphyromonas macacae]
MYKLNNDKAHLYTQSFDFRKGGRIEVWYKDFPQIKRIIRLKPVDKIKTAVVKSSSEESGFGDATHLTDGENTTMWHSVYSVTVAKYPHWVVFDAGEERQLKGMTYLPRQDGSNIGDIKEYEVYLSSDGEHWDKPVVKGVFDNSKNEKRISFTGKKKARYIKFVALSEQNGRDYASGAEMTILSD